MVSILWVYQTQELIIMFLLQKWFFLERTPFIGKQKIKNNEYYLRLPIEKNLRVFTKLSFVDWSYS